MMNLGSPDNRALRATIFVAALGYFVDTYDLLLFSIVRITSLKELGLQGAELLSAGVLVLNMQMAGMLLGGVLWGIWGDKQGRLSVLFGSIFLYSTANVVNAFVHTVPVYATVRFLAGVGLAGELGAGITLVAELLDREKRGIGTAIVASVGVLGVVVAAIVGDWFTWRTSYLIGGLLGFLLLLLRLSVKESRMFTKVSADNIKRGNLGLLFRNRERAVRYLCCILVGLPIWYAVGILVTFSPEIGAALQMPELPSAGRAVMFTYIGLVCGDLASGLLSQRMQSRKRVIALFLVLSAFACGTFLRLVGATPATLYLCCLPLGFALGYWAVFVTTAAEQFGTNLRATVAISVPNFVRGAVVPLTLLFQFLTPTIGVLQSAAAVGAGSFLLAALALPHLTETFSRELDYVDV